MFDCFQNFFPSPFIPLPQLKSSFNYKFSIKIFMNCNFINEWMNGYIFYNFFFNFFLFNTLDMQNTITIVFNKNIEEKKFQFVAELKWNTWQLLFIYYMYIFCILYIQFSICFYLSHCTKKGKSKMTPYNYFARLMLKCKYVWMYKCIVYVFISAYIVLLYFLFLLLLRNIVKRVFVIFCSFIIERTWFYECYKKTVLCCFIRVWNDFKDLEQDYGN